MRQSSRIFIFGIFIMISRMQGNKAVAYISIEIDISIDSTNNIWIYFTKLDAIKTKQWTKRNFISKREHRTSQLRG